MAVIYVKNMVCPRCIDAVESILIDLKKEIQDIELGEVSFKGGLSLKEKKTLSRKLEEKGFELLEDENRKLITKIKGVIIDQVHHNTEIINENLSSILAQKIGQDYGVLSKLFSSIEGITIEKYCVKQKVEKIKELIVYKELNFSQIANELGYSSVAHLSAQFKKETGMTPTTFKKANKKNRNSLDSI